MMLIHKNKKEYFFGVSNVCNVFASAKIRENSMFLITLTANIHSGMGKLVKVVSEYFNQGEKVLSK